MSDPQPTPRPPQAGFTAVPAAALPPETGFYGALNDLLHAYSWRTAGLVLALLAAGFTAGLNLRKDTATERFRALHEAELGYVEALKTTRDEDERRIMQDELSLVRSELDEVRREMGLAPTDRSSRLGPERSDPSTARVQTPDPDPAASPASGSRAKLERAPLELPASAGGGRVAAAVPQTTRPSTSARPLPPLELELSPYTPPDPTPEGAPQPEDDPTTDDPPARLASSWGFAQHTRLSLVAPPDLETHHAELTAALMRFFPPRAGTFDLPR